MTARQKRDGQVSQEGIKKIRSPEKTNEILEVLRAEYPQRRAFQEDLDSV